MTIRECLKKKDVHLDIETKTLCISRLLARFIIPTFSKFFAPQVFSGSFSRCEATVKFSDLRNYFYYPLTEVKVHRGQSRSPKNKLFYLKR